MLTLSSQLLTQCHNILLQCDQFKSDSSLRALLVTTELAPFRNRLHSASSGAERVEKTIEFLLEQVTKDGQPLLLPLLLALRDRYQIGDGLRDDLENLYNAVKVEVMKQNVQDTLAITQFPIQSSPMKELAEPTLKTSFASTSSHSLPSTSKTPFSLLIIGITVVIIFVVIAVIASFVVALFVPPNSAQYIFWIVAIVVIVIGVLAGFSQITGINLHDIWVSNQHKIIVKKERAKRNGH